MPQSVSLPAVLCLAAAVGFPAHGQQLYKSVDPDGRVVYSDRRPTEGRLEKTIKYEEQPSSNLKAQSSSYVEQLRRFRSTAPQLAAVPADGTVLYSAKWCGYCKQAKAFLASRNVPYVEFDIDTQQGLAAFANAGGGKGIPLLVHGVRRIQGFSLASYESVFAKAR